MRGANVSNDATRRAGPFLLEKEEDRVLLIKAVLHASDISNPVRPFHVNCVMSTSVHREFRCAAFLLTPTFLQCISKENALKP